jgi:hypothetical protein
VIICYRFSFSPSLLAHSSSSMTGCSAVMAQEAIDYATWNEDVANLTSAPYTLNSTVNVCYDTGLAQCQNGTLPTQWSGYEYDLAVAAFKMLSDAGDTAMDLNNINWLCGWPPTGRTESALATFPSAAMTRPQRELQKASCSRSPHLKEETRSSSTSPTQASYGSD